MCYHQTIELTVTLDRCPGCIGPTGTAALLPKHLMALAQFFKDERPPDFELCTLPITSFDPGVRDPTAEPDTVAQGPSPNKIFGKK